MLFYFYFHISCYQGCCLIHLCAFLGPLKSLVSHCTIYLIEFFQSKIHQEKNQILCFLHLDILVLFLIQILTLDNLFYLIAAEKHMHTIN